MTTDPAQENELFPEDPQAPDATVTENSAPEADASATAQEELARLKDQLLRTAAESENMRRRFQRDQEETAKYAVTGFARELVNVIENLQRASQSITPEARAENDQLKNLGDGVDMTMRELLGVFERHGIKRIDPLGDRFDHNLHQAVAQIESTGAEPGTVVQVLQAGYVIHDRLLRPAMVGVAKSSAPTEKKLDTKA